MAMRGIGAGMLAGLGAGLGAMTAPAHAAPPTWDIQFSEPFAMGRDVAVIDLDMDSPELIARAKAKGQRVLCYVSVGTAENWRADYAQFPKAIKGPEWRDWPGEYFLDIRQRDILLPIMTARFERCKRAGADGIDPDNQDQQWAGAFPVTEGDAVTYMRDLARIAHGMGLTIGQKNNPDTVDELVGTLDFIVTEDCAADGWCDQVRPYAAAGKPVFAIEYGSRAKFARACDAVAGWGFSMIRKDMDLSGRVYDTCP